MRDVVERLKRGWGRGRGYGSALLAGGFGIWWFVLCHGDRTLNPLQVDWLMVGDWSTHLMGWLFFRNESWSLPLGALPDLAWPLGTTVGFTDSNPLMALLLRPWVGVLPYPFQYIGLWLALCFFLQGFMGSRLTALLTQNPVSRLLGGMLFAMAPVVMWRMGQGHDSLCANWLLVGMIWVHLKDWPGVSGARRAVGVMFLLLALGAFIHPYLTAMLWALAVAALVRLRWVDRTLSWRDGGLAFVGFLGMLSVLFWLLGYLGTGTPSGIPGFGEVSADLLTLVNPMGWSRLLPSYPTGHGQYEGFSYLGAGVLALLAVGLLLLLGLRVRGLREWTPAWRRVLPLAVCCVLMAFYSLSPLVTFQGREVWNLTALYQPVLRFAEPFRSSGRFAWPLHYVLMAAALALVLGSCRRWPWAGAALLALAVSVQAFDLSDALRAERFQSRPWNGLRSAEWARMRQDYRHLALYPPQVHDGNLRGCPFPGGGALFSPMFAYLAARQKMTFNSAYLARVDFTAAQEICTALQRDVERGQLQPDTVYVVQREYLAPFMAHPEAAVCGVVDGYAVCVSSARESAFRRVLESRRLVAPAAPRP